MDGPTRGANLGTQRLILVTGPSGAGRSTAVKSLEDQGFEIIDNLPLSMVSRLLDGEPISKPLVLGIDTRNRDFSTQAMIELLEGLVSRSDVSLETIYLDCRTDVLLRRYSETRRRHPLAPAEDPERGIARELDLLGPIRLRADTVIDTSDMNPHELRAELDRWFGPQGPGGALAVAIHSFSYKRGMPRGLDMVFDCRFIKNPYWVEALRPLDGRHPEVAAYVQSDARYDDFFSQVTALIELLLPAHQEEGKSHLSIGFGCTGGQHRSVAVTEGTADALAASGWRVSKRHRELERRAGVPKPDESRSPA